MTQVIAVVFVRSWWSLTEPWVHGNRGCGLVSWAGCCCRMVVQASVLLSGLTRVHLQVQALAVLWLTHWVQSKGADLSGPKTGGKEFLRDSAASGQGRKLGCLGWLRNHVPCDTDEPILPPGWRMSEPRSQHLGFLPVVKFHCSWKEQFYCRCSDHIFFF